MPYQYGPTDLNDDDVASAAIYLQNEAEDQVFGPNPLLQRLMENPHRQDGGLEIVVPLEIEESAAVGSYTAHQEVNVDPQEILTSAAYQWRYYFGAITVSRPELRKNAGERRLNLLQTKIKNALKSLKTDLNRDLWATVKADADDVEPLPIYSAPGNTVGQINDATFAFWAPISTASGAFATQGVNDMRTLYHDLSNQLSEAPTDTVVTQDIYEAYEEEGVGLLQLDNNTGGEKARSMDLSFTHLMFKENPFYWDDEAPAGQVNMFNNAKLMLAIDSGDEFILGEFVKARNALVQTAIFTVALNLVTVERARQGRLTAVTT